MRGGDERARGIPAKLADSHGRAWANFRGDFRNFRNFRGGYSRWKSA